MCGSGMSGTAAVFLCWLLSPDVKTHADLSLVQTKPQLPCASHQLSSGGGKYVSLLSARRRRQRLLARGQRSFRGLVR